MKYIYGFVALVVLMCLGAMSLIVYAIVNGPIPDIPPDLLAIGGAYILMRLAIGLTILALVFCLLFLVVYAVVLVAQLYQGANQTDKERAKKGLCDSLNILKRVVEMLHEHHKSSRRSARPA